MKRPNTRDRRRVSRELAGYDVLATAIKMNSNSNSKRAMRATRWHTTPAPDLVPTEAG